MAENITESFDQFPSVSSGAVIKKWTETLTDGDTRTRTGMTNDIIASPADDGDDIHRNVSPDQIHLHHQDPCFVFEDHHDPFTGHYSCGSSLLLRSVISKM